MGLPDFSANAKADAEPSRGSSCCDVGTFQFPPPVYFRRPGAFLFPFAEQPVDVPANDARPSRVQRKPSRQLLDAQRAAKFGHDIDSVGRRRGAKRHRPREQGRRRDGKNRGGGTEKAGAFPVFFPIFQPKFPSFRRRCEGRKLWREAGERLALRRRAVLRSQHTIRGSKRNVAPHRKHDGGHRNESPGNFPR